VRGVFGWGDFVGEKMVGLDCFLCKPTTFQSPQIGEKMERRKGWMKITHLILLLPKTKINVDFFFSFF